MSGAVFLPGTVVAGKVYVEIAFGADLTDTDGSGWSWTDVTADVMYEQQVSITQGRADETSQASPAGCSFTLLNTTGNYTPFAPASTYYPNVARNTPVRVRVDPGTGTPVVRFLGYATAFTPGWDTTARRAIVAVTASGALQRLMQGKTSLRSALYQTVRAAAPIAYWPLEDGENATTAAGSTNNLAVAGTVQFQQSVLSIPGSAGAVDCTGGGSLSGPVGGTFSASHWQLEFVAGYRNSTVGSAPIIVWVITTTITLSFTVSTAIWDGQPHHLAFQLTQSGADTSIDTYRDGVFAATTVLTSVTMGTPVTITVNGPGNTGDSVPIICHIALFDTLSSPLGRAGAVDAYADETATDRLVRSCAELGVNFTLTGSSNTAMGAQPTGSFVDLLRECEAADGGLLYDGLAAGIGYIARSSRYNGAAALTLSMTASPPQVADPFTPVDDDQRNRNDVTMSRSGGSSARFVDSTGTLGTAKIGTYDSSETINIASDTGLLDQAAWRVHLGTVEGLRYPGLNLNLLATPSIITAWLATTLTNRLDITGVTSRATQHPPDDVNLAVEGWNEVLGTFTWSVALNCSPFAPWRVFVVEDSLLGRLGLDGQNLASGVNTTATSWSVASPTLPLLTTTALFPADFPYYLICDGEVVQVTATSGTSSPQTVTVVRSINGVVRSHSAGALLALYQPGVIGL